MHFADVRQRAATVASAFAYTTSGWLLGLVWFTVLVVLLGVAVGLAVLLVGLPLLALTLALARLGADAERARAALVLGEPIARPPRARGDRLLAHWAARLR